MSAYLLGVDIGTQGTKTCLYASDGRAAASAFEPSRLIEPAPGAVEQEPDELYGSVVRTIREVLEKSGVRPSDVAALGMDGQMAGILGVDGDFNAVTPYDSWLDIRCEAEIDEMRAAAGDRIIALTGAPVSYNHGPKVLRWKKRFPEAYARIAKFVLPVTYVAGRMCGLKADDAWIDYTCLHFSGFGDVEHLKWSEELLERFGVDGRKMPAIAEPWKLVGRITADAARECGLCEGTPVCAGAGDQAATSLGAGITRPGLAFDVAGTASVFSRCTDVYAPDVEKRTILCARSVLPGLWIPLAYIGGGGLCVRWIRDTLAGTDASVTYDRLAEEAGIPSAGKRTASVRAPFLRARLSQRRAGSRQLRRSDHPARPRASLPRRAGIHRLRIRAVRPHSAPEHRQRSAGGLRHRRRREEPAVQSDQVRRPRRSLYGAEHCRHRRMGRGHHRRPLRGALSRYGRNRGAHGAEDAALHARPGTPRRIRALCGALSRAARPRCAQRLSKALKSLSTVPSARNGEARPFAPSF